MRAGFEADIHRGAFGALTGRFQRVNLGMRLARTLMPTLANDLAGIDDDAAHHRVGTGCILAERRHLQRPGHVRMIGCGERGHAQRFFLPSSSGSRDICSRLAAVSEIFCSRLISSSNSVMSWKRR